MPRTVSENPNRDPVISDTLTTPPGSEVVGDRYIIAGIGGAWSGFSIGSVVEVVDSNPTIWRSFVPQIGWDVWVIGSRQQKHWDGEAWIVRGSGVTKLEDLEDISNASPGIDYILQANGTTWSAKAPDFVNVGLLRKIFIESNKSMTIPAGQGFGVISAVVEGVLIVEGFLKVV